MTLASGVRAGGVSRLEVAEQPGAPASSGAAHDVAPMRLALAHARADIARYVMMLCAEDAAVYRAGGTLQQSLQVVVQSPGLQAVLVHRFGAGVLRSRPQTSAGRTLRSLGRLAHFALARTTEMTTGIRINEHARIGPGLHIAHHGTTIIGPVTMGSNVTLTHSVTLGRSGRRRESACPTLGDRVWIGPGAVITGGLTIGDDAVIGANAVVTRSVASRAVAYGIPARVHSQRGSFEQVVYPGFEQDEARLRSLEAGRGPAADQGGAHPPA